MTETELIGKNESILDNLKQEYRIVSRDDKPYIVTCDFKIERLNIYIENNIIVKVTNG